MFAQLKNHTSRTLDQCYTWRYIRTRQEVRGNKQSCSLACEWDLDTLLTLPDAPADLIDQ